MNIAIPIHFVWTFILCGTIYKVIYTSILSHDDDHRAAHQTP